MRRTQKQDDFEAKIKNEKVRIADKVQEHMGQIDLSEHIYNIFNYHKEAQELGYNVSLDRFAEDIRNDVDAILTDRGEISAIKRGFHADFELQFEHKKRIEQEKKEREKNLQNKKGRDRGMGM